MRLGVFGGSFDPPHLGHFLAAVDASERLALDRVLWIPVAAQPLKADAALRATAEQRLQMVRLTIDGMPDHEASALEIERGGLSYTIETLTALGKRHPGAELVLLLGEDAWASFGQWREPERIAGLATIAVLRRGDAVPAAAAEYRPVQLPTRRVQISATEIRARVSAGLPIRGFVADRVALYIQSAGLYRGRP